MIKSVHKTPTNIFNPYVTKEKNPEMMNSEFSVVSLKENETFEITTQEEYIFCLNVGTVTFSWDTHSETVTRTSCFTQNPYVLHVHKDTLVTITACSAVAEVNVANTDNEKLFENKLYAPEDLQCCETVDADKLDGKTKRIKRIFFDRTQCPETNLFCGEVVMFPGCWACFPPHLHTEPEIYYYKFFPEQGYGFSEFEDEAIKVKNYSLTCNPGGQLHSQVAAPGYAGYIMWTQRLQNNGKNIEYTLAAPHAWLDAPDAAFFPALT